MRWAKICDLVRKYDSTIIGSILSEKDMECSGGVRRKEVSVIPFVGPGQTAQQTAQNMSKRRKVQS